MARTRLRPGGSRGFDGASQKGYVKVEDHDLTQLRM